MIIILTVSALLPNNMPENRPSHSRLQTTILEPFIAASQWSGNQNKRTLLFLYTQALWQQSNSVYFENLNLPHTKFKIKKRFPNLQI
jgi:hypothetical protein